MSVSLTLPLVTFLSGGLCRASLSCGIYFLLLPSICLFAVALQYSIHILTVIHFHLQQYTCQFTGCFC